MTLRFTALAFFLVSVVSSFAELPPSAYEAMQAKAPEYLQIEILRVDVEPGDAPERQIVRLMALVQKVERTATSLRAGDVINIVYTITDRPKGWAGPGEIPLKSERDSSVAYLRKDGEIDYVPVAGVMSFSNF